MNTKFNFQTMDSNSTELCRLCLQFSDDLVNIFETFENSTIASILTKHFWFQVNKNGGFTEWLCQICWIHTKTFHIYYKRMELFQRNHYKSSDLVGDDLMKEERNVSPSDDVLLELDLNIVKCEETELTVVDMEINKGNSSDYNEDNDASENTQTSDDDDQSSNETPKNDDIVDVSCTESQKSPPNIERKKYFRYSRSERDKQDDQIREFCTMKCEICCDVIEFETLLEARSHYRLVHKIIGYVMCCGKKFRKRCTIMSHITDHGNPADAYRCQVCGKVLRNKRTLKVHLDLHVPLDLRDYKCSLCSRRFSKRYYLTSHVQSKHSSKDGETFPCDQCNKKFRSKLLQTHHIRNVHESSRKYVCEICACRFKTKHILKNHVERKHSKTPRPKVQCNICNAWLAHEFGLKRHLKRHDRQKKDFVNCQICKKVCKDKAVLRSHIKNAHGERRHQCLLCDKAFKSTHVLKEHIATHTGEDLYNCPYCEKKFKSNGNMYAHRKKEHIAELTRDFPEQIKFKEKRME